eukprot:g23530.t1
MTCDECVDERMNEVIADHKEEMKLLRKKRRKKEDKPTAVIVLGGVGSGKTTFVKTRLDLELGKDYRNFWKTALALNADDLRSDLLGGYEAWRKAEMRQSEEVYSAYFTQAYFKETERSKAGPSQRVFQAGNRLRRAVQNDALEQQVNLIADSLTLPVFVAEEFKKTCKVKVFYIEIPGANWSQKVQTASEHVKHRMARGGHYAPVSVEQIQRSRNSALALQQAGFEVQCFQPRQGDFHPCKLLESRDGTAELPDQATQLGFFSNKESVDKKRTVGALLAVFWIVANQYDQFVRGQDEANRLSKESWEHLQDSTGMSCDWTRNTVRLTKSHSMVSAMLVYVAIMNVGKIKPFRAAFAPEEDEPTEALARILHRSPILVPSFAKLEPEQQQIILSALKADFNFGQFLQAENLPASLFTVRQILQEGIFAAMCGVKGSDSLEGSLFMTDTNYKNFEVGLDTLMHLMEETAPGHKRARLSFRIDGSRDQRALVRLACMMRAFDPTAGKRVQEAWRSLEDHKRVKLVDFLNADGIKITPAFILYFAPNFLENAKKNEGNFPLEMTFQVLLQVYEAAAKEYENSDQKVITVMVDALADFAKTCKHTEVFQFVKFEIARSAHSAWPEIGHRRRSPRLGARTPGQKGEVMGNLLISPWQLVVDKNRLDGLEQEAGNMFIELVPQTGEFFPSKMAPGPKLRGLKENVYLKPILTNLFPELGFFRDQDDQTKCLLRETLCRLLVVYWTATDQPEAFTRGQEIEKKLSESSWSKPGSPFSETLGEMKSSVASQILSKMVDNDAHARAAEILTAMDGAAELLAELRAATAAWVVQEMDVEVAANLLSEMAYVGAGYVLAELDADQAAPILLEMEQQNAAYILDDAWWQRRWWSWDMETSAALGILADMSSDQSAALLSLMEPLRPRAKLRAEPPEARPRAKERAAKA